MDQQKLQQQRLVLQKQQQRAQLHLQNLQIRQKKKLLEDQQQSLQSLQSEASQNPILLPLSSSENFISTPHYNSLLSLPPESLTYPPYAHPFLNAAIGNIDSNHNNHNVNNHNNHTTTTTTSPNLIGASGSTSSAMDILAMAPFPIHQHQTSLTTNSLLPQHAIHQIDQQQQQPSQQHQNQQQQPRQGQNSPFYHPLKFETNQSNQPFLNINMDTTGSGDVSVSGLNNGNGLQGYGTNEWNASANALPNENMALLGHSVQNDVLRRLSHSSSMSDKSVATSGSVNEMVGYSMNARIIRKKDQLEELSSSGAIITAPLVDEVRTGQQFLIKLQMTKSGTTPSSSTKFPAMRVERRDAINTAGEPRSEAEPLTLQIIVHLAKSGQIRKGACAKCCHKYGPSSPILVLLDPLSPSATDPASYAHVDTTSGSVTLLAKVICSSTDHGERGNKDQYVFEFRLKRTNTVNKTNMSPMGPDAMEDDGETVASCSAAPIMCSGHHKAKRVYPSQRPSKVTEDGPVPKTKVIKRHRSIPNAARSISGSKYSPEQTDEYLRSGSISSSSNYPSPMSFMQENFANAAVVSNFGDDQSSDIDFRGSTLFPGQPMLNASESESSSSGVVESPQFQPPRICEVRPDHGPIRKTTDVILRGLFFCDGMVPYFGCFPAQDIVVETSNLIICKAPESPLPGTVPITIYDNAGTNFVDLGQFTYTDDSETELLILQLQLRLAHRALEYLHTQATGQRGDANDILREMPGLSSSPRSNGPSPGGAYMMTDSAAFDEESDSNMLTLEQVEEGILKTLDQLPAGMDISMQLEGQGNLLHLSILQGFDKLTMRLIEDGCELEALDQWAMTPLMYAVIKGNESIVRALILAGASSSGAKTPREFYACLPRPVAPTRAVVGYLSISCARHSTTTRALVSSTTGGQPDMVEIENDEASISSDEESEAEEDSKRRPDDSTPRIAEQPLPGIAETVPEAHSTPVETGTFEQLAQRIRAVHINQDMLPLDQQGLPPMRTVESDGSVKINNTVLKGDEIPYGKVPVNNTTTTDSKESGYHSGIFSEVQDRLSHLSRSDLPAEGVQMTVEFRRGLSSVKVASPSSPPMPDNLFRTGDSFEIMIRLTTIDENNPLPSEFLGIRFPHEMVKRVNGHPASILNEMTYILKMSIELGQSNNIDVASSSSTAHDNHHHRGDGIDLKGSCSACSDYRRERKKTLPSHVSQEDQTLYPILQFNIPAAPMVIPPPGSASPQDLTRRTDVMELRNGQVTVKARVNCSSLHHLIQREKDKRTAELRLQQQQRQQQRQEGEESPSVSKGTKTPLDMKDLEDPGFVFTFELVHPTLSIVVARQQTGPILFQSYSRGRS
ncbi:SPT3 Dosage dependent suppressor of Ty-induced promoter mutations-like protein [Mortierella polycephala]|uniref:SPT3 Dosage dependent suppressor of Ty-induced promoter mutations-like protein n=1 Tax=Mortierella polycephala TaxID=41804 RepID=A0A9P6U687_9FUNG|nr:SPT3 Dosage dependent suppressor of Ty-induced promoter mutations-like protein [Mortierella polycephala]